MSNSPISRELQLDLAIRRRNRLHGWRWPPGAITSTARGLNTNETTVIIRRIEMLLEAP